MGNQLASAMQNSRKVLLEGNRIQSGLYPIAVEDTLQQPRPDANGSGRVALSAYKNTAPLAAKLWVIEAGEVQPRLLKDFYADLGQYQVTIPLVRDGGDILVLTSDPTIPLHYYCRIYKFPKATGIPSLVYELDTGSEDPNGYFWGLDSYNGYIWRGYKVQGGYHIIKSEDGGDTWAVKRNVAVAPSPFVYEIAAYNDKVFAAVNTTPPTLEYSGDGGATWSTIYNDGTSFEGVSLYGKSVYLPKYSGGVVIWPDYTAPTKYFDAWFPGNLSISGDYAVNRQLKRIGNWIVGNATVGSAGISYWGSCDDFYTMSPLFMFARGGPNVRFSGYGDTILIAGQGQLWMGRLPLPGEVQRFPCARRFCFQNVAGGATSALADSFPFDSRLAPRFTLTVKATYHAAAGAGVRVHVIGGGMNGIWDSGDIQTINPPFTAGQTKQQTYSYDSCGVIKVQFENLDANQQATVEVWGQLSGV